MTWEEFIKRGDGIGGDIETHEDGYIYRGPIESIDIQKGTVVIKALWMARMPEVGQQGFGNWEKWDIKCLFASLNIQPSEIGQGRVQFNMPMIGIGVIFPKGGSKLDPAKVKGLAIH